MATKLEVYNQTLRHLRARRIASLTDARSERRELDSAWAGTLDWMLEQGLWNFASRAQQWDPSSTVDSEFGYQYVYEKPDDYVKLVQISDNERFVPTLPDFSEEGDYFMADCDPLWVMFVSNDSQWGYDPGKWPPGFTRAFALELAVRVPKVGNLSATDREEVRKEAKRKLYEAKGSDAMNQPMGVLPPGRLVSSRGGFGGNNRMRRTPYA